MDATGGAGSFNTPSSLAVDISGNVHVADSYNNRVRKVTPAGLVSTSMTGIACQAVAVDRHNNLYMADSTGSASSAIRWLSPAGTFGTMVTGKLGFGDGAGAAVGFRLLAGMAVDAAGNVYVADRTNHAVRKVTPTGVVSTLAGGGVAGFKDGAGSAAAFNAPNGVALDSGGNVYVADTGNHAVRKITPGGVVSTLAGSGAAGLADGVGAAARFRNPYGVAVDGSGNVYVADTDNQVVRKITPAGVVTVFAGRAGVRGHVNGPGGAALFQAPRGVAWGANDSLYVADTGNNAVRRVIP